MREFLPFALSQNHADVGIERKALFREDECKALRFVDGLLRSGGPHLCREHIACDQLIAHFGIDVRAKQLLLLDRFALRRPKLIGTAAY